MKALIIKDFRLLKYLNISHVIVGGIFAFVGVTMKEPFLSQIVFVFLVFLLTYMSAMFISVREAKIQGDIILNSLPVKKGEIVKARYLSLFFYSIIISGYIYVVGFFTDIFMGPVNFPNFSTILVAISLSLMFLVFSLPFQYYSIGKVQIFNGIFYMCLILIPNIFNRYRDDIFETDFVKYLLSLDFTIVSIILFALAIALYVFSFTVSLTIYKNKEF
ncbi:ABC-2 family transporter protein [Desulfonispora thiosulfatigenes DSM 11270]|uniref:ABC-2 family transporter protein n=1 Tax=Desulfonispora thiosulfatigenes DSM 11270 TaxID=656914 RepID=A0A1W1UWD3_DESTI|nr:ABC-2 transporter permease [Desulfonispora thiosulfatigenes]SMB85101.1 ABC-2 family transporter protein [Desulfonispora thiosulfatigenes DSM 11270]